MCFYFFFSSRRRHTRYIGDWSSDVCSSDLEGLAHPVREGESRIRPGAWAEHARRGCDGSGLQRGAKGEWLERGAGRVCAEDRLVHDLFLARPGEGEAAQCRAEGHRIRVEGR